MHSFRYNKRARTDGQNETDEMVKQDGYRTDRASAFVIERVKMFLTSGLISMQNLIVVTHTRAYRP